MQCTCSCRSLLSHTAVLTSFTRVKLPKPAAAKSLQLCLRLFSSQELSSSSSQQTPRQVLADPGKPAATPHRPKLHWTEEFKIRSPKVPASQLERDKVVAIDILSDAYADVRPAFFLRRTPLGGPLNAGIRGGGKVISWIAIGSLPYLLFCKWAGGTPLLGDMTTYTIPVTVLSVALGYLGLNWALERAVFRRRIYRIALDELDPSVVYITTLPVGGWLHGSFQSYATRLDNLTVEKGSSFGAAWARLRFKTGAPPDAPDWLSLPLSSFKLCIVDERAMATFADACLGPAGDNSVALSVKAGSGLLGFERTVLPSDAQIDRHLDTTLWAAESKQAEAMAGETSAEQHDPVKESSSKA